MSGFMFCTAPCRVCTAPIMFNPTHVPSIRVNGKREAICQICFARWNEIHRTSKGRKPVLLHPEAFSAEPV